jgi:hypothetical protein
MNAMKYFLALAALVFLTTSCSNENEMKLNGNIKGLKRGTILLQKLADTSFVSIDSLKVGGSSAFAFSDFIESPEQYFLYVRQEDGDLKDVRLPFFAEPGELTINSTIENLALDATVTGSKNQALYENYQKLMVRYNDRNLDLIEEAFNAKVAGNDSLSEVLSAKQQSNIRSKYLATVNFAMNNNDIELAPYLALSEIFDANVTYLDTVYKTLTPRIKESKYGKALEDYIKSSKDSN